MCSKNKHLKNYVQVAPIALSIVRAIEGRMFDSAKHLIERPILDIGCGDGLFSKTCLDYVIDAGIDLDPHEVELAERTGSYGEIKLSNVSSIPYPDENFSTVISNCVFEHVKPLEQAFAEIYRVLKPGGRYIFTAHSHHYNEFLFWPRLLKKAHLNFLGDAYIWTISTLFRHYNCFAPEKWRDLLLDSGFSSVTTRHYLDIETETWFDLLLPLAAPSYLCKRLTGKWVVLPWFKFITWAVWGGVLEDLDRRDCKEGEGGALLIIAEK